MRKAEKIELEKAMYGLSLTQCPEHQLPLVYHVHDPFGQGYLLEACWDCPVEGCDWHVHEGCGVIHPWSPVDTVSELNHKLWAKTMREQSDVRLARRNKEKQ